VIKGFSHIYVPALDLDESIKFYIEVLGFELFRRWQITPDRGAAYVRLNGILLEMGQVLPENREKTLTGGATFALEVSDLEGTLAKIRAQGVEVLPEGPLMKSFAGRQIRIKDPSGWEIPLREWRAPDSQYADDYDPGPSPNGD
jgi:catechol 2,3-dioxygenase-like lactoylglutathione lyase family enzyme